MTPTRAHALAAGVTGVCLLLAACGDDGTDGTAAPGVTDPPAVTETDTATETATETDTATETETATETDSSTVTATDTETVVETQTETVDADDTGAEPDDGIDADTRPDTREGTGEPVTLVDVRVGSHPGYDRVVWEFAGDGTPGWRAEYVDDPARQGSGQPVELPGDATLSVAIDNTAIPTDAPSGVTPYTGTQRLAAASFEVVTEVVPGGWFEGMYDGFVGVGSEQPFRVRLFEDPTRVVLDVET